MTVEAKDYLENLRADQALFHFRYLVGMGHKYRVAAETPPPVANEPWRYNKMRQAKQMFEAAHIIAMANQSLIDKAERDAVFVWSSEVGSNVFNLKEMCSGS